jgi:hypothetical protein
MNRRAIEIDNCPVQECNGNFCVKSAEALVQNISESILHQIFHGCSDDSYNHVCSDHRHGKQVANTATALVREKCCGMFEQRQQQQTSMPNNACTKISIKVADSTILQEGRIRKVSDVSILDDIDGSTDEKHQFMRSVLSKDGNNADNESPFAAHLAVVAVNLFPRESIGDGFPTEMYESVPIVEEYLQLQQQFFECQRVTNTSRKSFDCSTKADNEKLLLQLYNEYQLPHMLDLSIMLETYLRNMALRIVRCLSTYFTDKALREFLGYKSATGKTQRAIVEILSDFLFDVSHAMVS